MSTTVEPKVEPKTEAPAAPGELRFPLPGIGWEGYEKLLEIIGDRPIRVTYDRGDAELMSPLYKHERNSSLIGQMVIILTDELDIPMACSRATTLKLKAVDRGLEADDSFYLYDLDRLHDQDIIDLTADPPPDLAIEIEITRSVLNRLGIYGALGVPEVWRFNGRQLRVLLRQEDGSYRESETSRAFPTLLMPEVVRFLTQEDTRDQTRWGRRFRAWVREVVVPRHREQAGGN
jgi:Uma2 family endonuclease